MTSLWPVLESVPSLTAPPEAWREYCGAHFDDLLPFLVVHHPTIAEHRPPLLHRMEEKEETTQAMRLCLRLDLAAFGHSVSQALSLAPITAGFPLPATFQIGAWSADAVPAIPTIQSDARDFRLVVAELVARLRQPFILLGPTNKHFTGICQELLANVGAGYVALENHVDFVAGGVFRARGAPGEVFARFTPEPRDPVAGDVARRAFGLLQRLDATGKTEPPSVLTVFRLFCVEERSVAQVARVCHCSEPTVRRRLKLIEAKTGTAPEALRKLSSHLEPLRREFASGEGDDVDDEREG